MIARCIVSKRIRNKYENKLLQSASALALVWLAGAAPAMADDFSWTGAVDTDALAAGNYSPVLPATPGAGDRLLFHWLNGGMSNTPQINRDGVLNFNVEVGTQGSFGSLDILNGELSISWGKTFAVATDAGSSGVINVTGENSKLSMNYGRLQIGKTGDATLNILGGGIVDASLIVGEEAGAIGKVLVDGLGSHLIGSAVFGKEGTGVLNVADGGLVSTRTLVFGDKAGSLATATIDGQDSTIDMQGADLGFNGYPYALMIGSQGTATVTVQNGGKIINAGALVVGFDAGGKGTLIIDGAGSLLSGTQTTTLSYYIGSASGGSGTLIIRNGGLVTAAYMAINPNGKLIVEGPNSKWDVPKRLMAMYGGSLAIRDGGQVNVGRGYIGDKVGHSAAITVDGSSSGWNITSIVELGLKGSTWTDITNGGSVTSSNVYIGKNADSVSIVTINGADSSWTVVPDTVYGNYTGSVFVGLDGSGVLTISDGAIVKVTNKVYIGYNTAVSGVLNIGAAAGDPAAKAGFLTTDSIVFGAGTGTLNFNYTDTDYLLAADISGNGTINQTADTTGTTTLTGDGSGFAGTTNVKGGALQIGAGGRTGALNGTIVDDSKVVFNRSDDLTFTGTLQGAGSMEKLGAGTLTMTGDSGAFAGDTTVRAGTLWINGILGGTVDVASGASLGGTKGTIGGNTTVASGGTLIGNQGNVLTFNSDLTLNSGSNVNVALGQASNAAGLFYVHGNLALNGSTLNITDQGDFGVGTYRLFDYDGSLSGDLTLGNVPTGSDRSAMNFDKSNPGHYNLYFAGQIANNIWDGGDGIWNTTNRNWTDINHGSAGIWNQGDYAQFNGPVGHHVTVDDSGGDITAQGLVFSTDGYVLDGGYLTLTGDKAPTIRVGDGSAGGANITATISTVLHGTQGVTKIDYGTLVLTGENDYSGGTTINQGTLQLGDGNNTGSIQGDVVVNVDPYGHGTLAFDRSDTYSFSGNISGGGDVVQRGAGTTVFEGNNTFSGGLTVERGTAQAGIADHAFGSGLLTVDTDGTADLANFNETVGGLAGSGHVALGSGTLTLNQGTDTTFSGGIDGTGGLTKNGIGKLTLSGTGNWSGNTDVNGGSLIQGAAGGFSASSNYSVAKDAVIDLGGFATSMASLNNSGIINFGGNGGTTLNVAGNYTGNGGTVVINSVLGGDGSTTDVLKVGGDTSGNTHLKVINRGGLGDQTVNGIEVVDVQGNSNGTFSLMGDFVTKDGKEAVSGGAYAYTLQRGPGTGNDDGNWYLTSQRDDPDPRYSPSVPVYEGYLNNMQALNKLPTLQERVGERYWTDKNGDGQTNGAAVNDKGVWARVEGAHNRLEPDTSLTRMKQDVNTFIMQAGVDGQFYEGTNGKLIAGLTGQYGHAKGDISSFHGDGAISTDAWSLGATTTWYGNSGFYVDGQAQVTWFDSDLNSWTANQGLADGRKATGYALSIEAGQRFAIDQNWSLTPQAQLMYSSINANAFDDTWGSRVRLHDGDSLIGRIGLAANYANSWKGDDGLMVNTTVYGIANLYQEMLGGSSANVAGVDFDTDNDKRWGGIGAGGTYAWADNKYAIYGEGSINTAFNHFADSYALKGTAGFKVKW